MAAPKMIRYKAQLWQQGIRSTPQFDERTHGSGYSKILTNELEAAVVNGNESESTGIERDFIIIWAIFTAVILTIIAFSVVWLYRQMASRQTPQQGNPVIFIPTAAIQAAMPASYFSIRLPVILSGTGPAAVFEQIWKVTEINNLGYESGGRRYDLATFTRIDGQDKAQGYCINQGWDVPELGAEYLFTSQGTFVPLQEPKDDPLQRFLKIQ